MSRQTMTFLVPALMFVGAIGAYLITDETIPAVIGGCAGFALGFIINKVAGN